jgi:excisionase family DNA binding protein
MDHKYSIHQGRLTLKVEEAAKLLGIGRNTAYEAVRTGEIPVVKFGRRLLVPREALNRLLAQEPSAACAVGAQLDVACKGGRVDRSRDDGSARGARRQ